MEELTTLRLKSQLLYHSSFRDPVEVVKWFGAVQAQDYGMAKWGLGLRTRGVVERDVDTAFNQGKLLRTHLMRPTWHFVLPEDIRWLIGLTAERVKAAMGTNNRKLGLDGSVFARGHRVFEQCLQGGQQLSRQELAALLKQAGIAVNDLRLSHLLIEAELEQVICSGARRGKQFTYTLLDERAPQGRKLEREAALWELTGRYFQSHGPAQLKDFAWWSGLTLRDAKAGLDMAASQLEHMVIDDKDYWFSERERSQPGSVEMAYLLPNYDEYTVGYTDRSAVHDEKISEKLESRDGSVLTNVMVYAGQILGTWKRTFQKKSVTVELKPLHNLSEAEQADFRKAAERYQAFTGMDMDLVQARAE